MEFVLRPPALLAIVLAAVVLAGIAAALLRKWGPIRKATAIVFVVVVCGGLLVFLYAGRRLTIDDRGIEIHALRSQSIPWSSVKDAIEVDNLPASPYETTQRSIGISLGSYRMGWYRLAGGGTAYAILTIADRALVIDTGSTRYVFGLPQMDDLLRETARHVTVRKWHADVPEGETP